MSYDITVRQIGVVETHIRAIEKLNPDESVKGHLAGITQAIDEVRKYLDEKKGILTRPPTPIFNTTGLKELKRGK